MEFSILRIRARHPGWIRGKMAAVAVAGCLAWEGFPIFAHRSKTFPRISIIVKKMAGRASPYKHEEPRGADAGLRIAWGGPEQAGASAGQPQV